MFEAQDNGNATMNGTGTMKVGGSSTLVDLQGADVQMRGTGFTPNSLTVSNTSGIVLDATNSSDGIRMDFSGSNSTGDMYQRNSSGYLNKLTSVASGNVLLSGGVASLNSWGKVGLTTHVSGVLPTANGGTGISTVPASDGSEYQLTFLNGVISWVKVVDENGTSIGNKTKLQAGAASDWDVANHYVGTTSGAITGTFASEAFYGIDAVNGFYYRYEAVTDNNWYRVKQN
jgi:hypothetical protein